MENSSGVVLKDGLLESGSMSVALKSISSVRVDVRQPSYVVEWLLGVPAALIIMAGFAVLGNSVTYGLITIGIGLLPAAIAYGFGMDKKTMFRLMISVAGTEQIAFESPFRDQVDTLREKIREAMAVL